MAERLEALLRDGDMEFWGNKDPKCPHCGQDYDIQDHEAWNLYEEGEHDIECPACDLTYMVSVNISYSYNTDDQPDEDQ